MACCYDVSISEIGLLRPHSQDICIGLKTEEKHEDKALRLHNARLNITVTLMLFG